MKHYLTSLLLISALLCAACQNTKDHGIEKFENPAGNHSELPYLYADENSNTFFSWVEPGSEEGRFVHLYASLKDGKWEKPDTIAQSKKWFVNWADYPSLIAHSGEAVAAHELFKIPGSPYSYNVQVRFNRNGSWTDPITPHFDSTATEHGFVSMQPLSKDEVFAIWLDGRQTHDRSDEEYFDLDKAMTLRSAIIHSSGEVSDKHLIDESVCDCCPTSLAMTDKGFIAAYRNRTDEEIRDIYISRYEDGQWSEPVPVHNDGWKIGACPVNGPKIAARGSNVVVAWYTSANGVPAVKASISKDYGKSFEEPRVIDKDHTIGRVDVAITDDSTAYVSRISRSKDEGHALKVTKLSFITGMDSTYIVAGMKAARSSGFPQMEFNGKQLIFAWTDILNDSDRQIRTAKLKVGSPE